MHKPGVHALVSLLLMWCHQRLALQRSCLKYRGLWVLRSKGCSLNTQMCGLSGLFILFTSIELSLRMLS